MNIRNAEHRVTDAALRRVDAAAIESQIENVVTVGGWHTLKGRGEGRFRVPTPFQGVPPSDIMNLTVNKRFYSSSPSARRGVLLLVVLALLAIFGLIGVAFVVLTGQAQRGAKSHERIDQVTDPPKNLLQQVLMQVLHGPTVNPTTQIPNPASVMGAHSLFEDMYSNGWVKGTIQSAVAVTSFPQLLNVTQTGVLATEVAKRGGCVLTITGPRTSPCYGQSTRIVALDQDPSTGKFKVMAFPDGSVPQQGDTFVINGVPFSGPGFGFKPDPTGTGKWVLDGNLALQPNAAENRNPESRGASANPNYTAADHQHILLAAQVPNANAPGGIQTLPSLHRPALIQYWKGQTGWTESADSYRPIMLRPLGKMATGTATVSDLDHPDFDGSNPKFNPTWDGVTNDGSRWDVDNRGTGVPDSIWVDLGMPVRSTTDGHLYKPLVAILCVDLDGRLNLNAHGSLAQVDASALISPAGGTAGDNGVRGQGLGPAEINLLPLLGDATTYSQLLVGGTLSGRYGSRKLPGSAVVDPAFGNKWFEYGPTYYAPNSYWDFSKVNYQGSYGTPPDPFGVGNVTLDTAGRPVYKWTTTGNYGFGSGINNTPYQLNLGPNAIRGFAEWTNSPFSPSEMEQLLRPYDRDAPSLPSRLASLTSSSSATTPQSVLLGSWAGNVLTPDYSKQLSFTTDSFDVPCPAVSGTDRIVVKLKTRAIPVPEAKWPTLLPPEVLAGLKMNLNPPFGNGQDDNGNNVVDENGVDVSENPPAEGGEKVTLSNQSVAVSYDGTKTLVNPLQARQMEARHLYVLACLTADMSSIKSNLGGTATYEDVARFLAQWAVNAVDFRDRDSIMTRFDFDAKFADPAADLSTGWVDPTDGKHTVFGCERPELLLTEAFAPHDRRTEDTNLEQVDPADFDGQSSPGKTTDTGAKHDGSFDQRFKPQGSLFIELFNPWTSEEPRPQELCKGTVPTDGVDLMKMTPPTAGTSWPVWRLAIADQVDAAKDPDYYDPSDTLNLPKIERTVYFVGPKGSLPADGAKVQFRQQNNNLVAPILPGRYAIVGPGDVTDGLTSTTYLGFRNGENPGKLTAKQRRIVLMPKPDPNAASQVQIFNDGTNNDLAGVTIQPPVAIIINSPRRLSISEPDAGYYNNSPDANNLPNGPAYNAVTGYSPAWDRPLDRKQSSGTVASLLGAIRTDGQSPHVKIIYLQRLANPLKPYNNSPTSPDYNPYRTVDQLPIDLFAFNGITPAGDPDVLGKGPLDPASGKPAFYARQRGQNNGTALNNLWRQEDWATSPKANTPTITPDLSAFNLQSPLNHTLGFLNNPFGAPQTAPQRGDPGSPFPWLTWNNRPYVSPLELMQVSWLHSSQLLATFKMADAGDNPYTNPPQPFSHLMNFFPSGTTTAPNEELHRMFEYLGVPSAFVGTETWANPSMADASTGHPFHPPFNRISAYREPGRINLNTIYGDANGAVPPVWQGLMAGFPALNTPTAWQNFVASRRGSGGAILDPPGASLPTEFAHPFRSFSGANLAPLTAMNPTHEINATLLREGPTTPGQPLFNYASTSMADNTDRNPYFRYQALQRLENLVTTRSNVYAVWITVGYFEVTPISATEATEADHATRWPDGYKLGRELGIDTGEVERHRAFYIIDRTIPVGFQRGQDLNSEKAILVNRFIE